MKAAGALQVWPWRGFAAVFGGFLLQFTMGAFYSFANMSTYMTSYMRANGNPNIQYTDFLVVQSAWGMTQGIVMPLSGFLITAIGEKASMVIGSIIFSAGCALTYITINKELWMVAATYGFVSAFGQNIALIPTLTTGMKWFPMNKGKAMGCVVGGFGLGSFVFNFIQTAIINPDNINVEPSGPDEGYFTDPDLLNRVPTLLLILAGIYLATGLLACLLITQPPADWLERQEGMEEEEAKLAQQYVTPCEAFQRKELYLLWVTRLSMVLITQVVAGLYKAFGQTFIRDDHFLGTVAAVTSVFNFSGRLLYGTIMDRTAYKVSMSIESILLILLMSTFYLTSLIGVDSSPLCDTIIGSNMTTSMATTMMTTMAGSGDCVTEIPTTSVITKAVFAIWVWAIFLTFPGTYSTQPAVTTQTFGHKYGGFIYAFLFSSDIINNLLVATMSKAIQEKYGWLGLFLIVSAFGFIALGATFFYPMNPSPGPRPTQAQCEHPWLAKVGLVEITGEVEEGDVKTTEKDNLAFQEEEEFGMRERNISTK